MIPQGFKASTTLGKLKSRREEMLCSEQLCPAGTPHGLWGLCTSSQWGFGHQETQFVPVWLPVLPVLPVQLPVIPVQLPMIPIQLPM